jgi:hypothetical protein
MECSLTIHPFSHQHGVALTKFAISFVKKWVIKRELNFQFDSFFFCAAYIIAPYMLFESSPFIQKHAISTNVAILFCFRKASTTSQSFKS